MPEPFATQSSFARTGYRVQWCFYAVNVTHELTDYISNIVSIIRTLYMENRKNQLRFGYTCCSNFINYKLNRAIFDEKYEL
jgi:hypothetical protein